jgi:phage shock protein C
MIDFQHKRLYRSPKEAILLGIAAGLGHYFEVDPVFVRLVLLVLAVVSGGWPVLVAYAILFFVIPIDPSQDTVAQRQEPKDVTPEK